MIADLTRKIDLQSMVAYAGATWDWHEMHYDRAVSDAAGLPGPVVDGQVLAALMAEQVMHHFGPKAFITELEVRYKSMVFAGDTVRCGAKVDGETIAQTVTVEGRVVAEGFTKVRT